MLTGLAIGAELAVLDFAGLSLTGTDFSARFLVDFDVASQYPLEAIMADAPSDFPTFIRGDPQDRVVPLHITIDPQPPSQNLIDVLKRVFTPSADIDYLRVWDENGNVRRMRVKSLGLAPWEGFDDMSYVASLHAPEPVWEADVPDVVFFNVSGAAGAVTASWEVLNDGNEETYPVITITPYANRAGAGAGHHQLPVVIAWRSPLEGVDSQGLPYPIDVTNAQWNTSGLADFAAGGAHVRVWLDGVEISRYLQRPATSTTSVWCSIPFQPGRIAQLAVSMDASQTTLTVTDATDLAAFPDSGAVLILNECIEYQGKTATQLLGLKRGRRGTAAATHATGAFGAVYWVEHDIRVTWGDTTFGVAAGMELADEKPIIDMANSTNGHHRYGTTDGLIEPDTLRSGQWVRELRAPPGSRRAAYAALSQTAGVVSFVDQLPEAGAPNFDSLSLYTPCLVRPNITGVALDVEVDHVMACAIYGVDVEGFESLLHKRDCLGWIPGEGVTDGAAREDYLIDAPSFASIAFNLEASLARLTISGYTGALVGIWNSANGAANTSAGENKSSAQVLRLTAVAQPRALLFGIVPFFSPYTNFDGDLYVRCYIPEGVDLESVLLGSVQILNADLPAPALAFVPITVQWGSEDSDVLQYTGILDVEFDDGGTAAFAFSGVPLGTANPPRYPAGSMWTNIGGAGWVEFKGTDIYVMASDGMGAPQADADLGTGFDVQVRNVDVYFDTSYLPLVVMGTASACYILNAEVLTNTDTGEALTLTGVLPIDANQAHDIAKIDASAHVLTVQRDDVNGYEQAAGYFAEPSSVQSWMRLRAGLNHFTYSNGGGGMRLAVKMFYRRRWT